MKKSTKAALLSALIFPGVGHFFLKKKATGTVLIVLAVYGLYYIISSMAAVTASVIENVQNSAVVNASGVIAQPDMAQLRELIMAELASPNSPSLSLAMSALMLVWFAAILDAYRLGLKQDKSVNDEH